VKNRNSRNPETERENDGFLDEQDDGTSESSLEEILDTFVFEFDRSTNVVLAGFLPHASSTASENLGTTSFTEEDNFGDKETTAESVPCQ
jgi:hypothetical protein